MERVKLLGIPIVAAVILGWPGGLRAQTSEARGTAGAGGGSVTEAARTA
jgi:hypothetical protein